MIVDTEMSLDRVTSVENVSIELARCLRLLAALFPDDDFAANPPALHVVDDYPPLRETAAADEVAHQIYLYTHGELDRPMDQV